MGWNGYIPNRRIQCKSTRSQLVVIGFFLQNYFDIYTDKTDVFQNKSCPAVSQTLTNMQRLLGFVYQNQRISFREATKRAGILSRICDNQWKGEPFWLASLMSKETKPRLSPSNLSGNPSVNIAPVSSLLGLQCGSKAVCRMDGSCLAARVNTLPFCCIPRIHYTASEHTGGAVRSYQFHYPLNPLTGALTC